MVYAIVVTELRAHPNMPAWCDHEKLPSTWRELVRDRPGVEPRMEVERREHPTRMLIRRGLFA